MKKARQIFLVPGLFFLISFFPAFAQSPKCLLKRAAQKKAVPQPSKPIPPLPTDDEIPAYDFSTYEGAVESAIADLKWRQERQSIWIASEESDLERLLAANAAPELKAAVEDISALSERGAVSGDILRDAQIRLKMAASVSRAHGENQLSERFEAEASWVSKWRGISEMNPRPAESQRRLWQRVATVWSRNAEMVVGAGVAQDEPFKQLVEWLSPEAAKGIKSGAVWSNVFGIDLFYSMVRSDNPAMWMMFKLIPDECFHGEHSLPKGVSLHGELQQRIESLAKELSRY